MKTSITKLVTALMFLLCLSNSTQAVTKVTIANGDWFNPAIWSPAGVPVMVDSLFINHQVTFNQNIYTVFYVSKMFRINTGASLKSVNSDDSLHIAGLDYFINRGEIVAAYILANAYLYSSNTGTIITTGHLLAADVFYNETGGVMQVGSQLVTVDFINKSNGNIQVGFQLVTSENFTNNAGGIIVITGSLITSDDMLNNGDITCSGWINTGTVTGVTGKFCVSGVFINSDIINGTVDICDATPNTIFDINTGTVSASVTYCTKGPCATTTSTISTGIAYYKAEGFKMDVYPNPANDVIFIDLEIEENFKYEIYNTIGQIMKSSKIDNQRVKIDVSDLNSGIYYITLMDGNNLVSTKKIIITK